MKGIKIDNLSDYENNIPVFNGDQKNFGKKEALFIQIVSKCQPIKSKEDLRQKVEAAGLSWNDFYSTFEFLVKIKFLRFQKEAKNEPTSGWCIDPRVMDMVDKEYPKQLTRFDIIDDSCYNSEIN